SGDTVRGILMKSPFARKKRGNEEMTLQITSMADVFTIILVFLLKSYSTSSLNISPTAGLRLPEAKATDDQVEAVKVEVSESAVQVEGLPVSVLQGFHFDKGDLQPNGVPITLGKALERERKRQTLIAQSNSDVKIDQKILIV